MKKVIKFSSFFGVLCLTCINYGVNAADRDGNPTQINRAVTTARMPSMPIANISVVDVQDLPENATPAPQPSPIPDPKPEPDPKPDPNPQPECPDGGVRNSAYTVQNCMTDVLSCVNDGALVDGINGLFDEDTRNAVINGMNLCYVQTEYCVETIRKNCKYVYKTPYDVWLDFNSREIQPRYYNFVLQKTGLTPYQAENTCWLLDKNTYGTSFNAVSNGDIVTAEYNNQVGAYNSQPKNLTIKKNPQGATVNNGNPGVDGQRGHYARWDAKTATCLVRVAAYNKDKPITNSWLFGALGDDEMAQVWKPAGDTFTCNKDLFGFSLMNDTKTTAVVGVGGGTLVGAGIGAAIGAGKTVCDNKNDTQELFDRIGDDAVLGFYLDSILSDNTISDQEACKKIVDFYNGKSSLEIIDESTYTGSESKVSAAVAQLKADGYDIDCTEVTCLAEKTTEINLISYFGNPGDNGSIAHLIEHNNAGKGALIGAASGAGAGGLATAISAFVEKNNIACHIGDDLDRVAFGKSYSIGSLRDFYIKWNLNLPDTMQPTVLVTDCESWQAACTRYRDLNQCVAATFNYKPAGQKNVTLVYNPCTTSGSVCVMNDVPINSYGVCEKK